QPASYGSRPAQLGHPGTWAPGHLGTRAPGHLATRAPEHLGTRAPGHPGTWAPGHPGTRAPDTVGTLVLSPIVRYPDEGGILPRHEDHPREHEAQRRPVVHAGDLQRLLIPHVPVVQVGEDLQ